MWLCLLFVLSCFLFVPGNADSFHMHPIYRHLAKKSFPRNSGGGPLDVHVGFYIESLGNFRSTEMSFDLDVYMYTSWIDDRLRHNQSGYVIVNDKQVLDRIWLPDLYFANARTAYFHEVTTRNFNMFIAGDGTVSYGTRVTLNLACHLRLQNYPLDRQTCIVKILSYAHVKGEMNATWFVHSPIRYNPEIVLPEFHIVSLEHGYCDGVFQYTITANGSRTGDFSCLLGMLNLKRAIGYHIVQSYIPAALIVAISWVSFWIDRRAVPARVSLSFTTLLTLSTQGNGIRYTLPPVSYAKAIDFFYGVCLLFIFGVLLEFTLVNSYMRRSSKFQQMAEKLVSGQNKSPSDLSELDSEGDGSSHKVYGGYTAKNATHLTFKAVRYSRRALAIDKTCRYVFPLAFTVFNIFYWMYYLMEDFDFPQFSHSSL